MRPKIVIFSVIASLVAVEGLAWWWMNPPLAGAGEPVLAYRPGIRSQECTGSGSVPSSKRGQTGMAGSQRRQTGVRDQEEAPAQDTKHHAQGTSSTTTPLPEIYRQVAPVLRCSDGQVSVVETPDNITLHLAFFEWNDTDTGSVFEAFRHMPEACMGSIGMKLISKEKPIPYTVMKQGAGDSGQETAHANAQSSSSIQNPTPPPGGTTLLFDHTVFEDPVPVTAALQPPVHAFRAVWVAGMDLIDARRGIDGESMDRLRAFRIKAAVTRYRPHRTCVVQGAVHGAMNAEEAWQTFERHMLRDLTFTK